MTFSTYIKLARERKGLYQKDVALQVQITAQYLNDLERGRREPSDAVLCHLADTLGFDTDFAYYLVGKLPPDLRDGLTKSRIEKAYRLLRKKAP